MKSPYNKNLANLSSSSFPLPRLVVQGKTYCQSEMGEKS